MEPNHAQPHRSRTLIGGIALVLALALVVGLLVASSRKSDAGHAQKSSIWKPGTTWTVSVKQDSAIASPEHEGTTYEQVYDFHVASAPASATGYWRVDASLVDAQGPFADGFHLFYVKDGNAFVLKKVAVGKQDPVSVKYAPTLLGQGFPLQQKITATPKDQHLVAANGGQGAAH